MNMRTMFSLALSGMLMLCAAPSVTAADPGGGGKATEVKTDLDYAQVVFVEAIQGDDGSWCIHTTVRHNDQGWDHYANAWQVVDQDGNELAWRLLAHPHDDEQPFVRDKCRIDIPPHLKTIVVQAKCTVHGFGGQAVTVDMTAPEGKNFKVTGTAR